MNLPRQWSRTNVYFVTWDMETGLPASAPYTTKSPAGTVTNRLNKLKPGRYVTRKAVLTPIEDEIG